MKLGRNDKCWCGSGLKFKRCHLDREREKPISKGEILSRHNNLMKKEICYAPKEIKSECSKIIKAHTISKSSGLTEIADDTNHVLGLKYNLATIEKNKGVLNLEKIGINNASTFKGFCSKHDKVFFASFEDYPFTATKEQCFGLTYRALARELYAKDLVLSHLEEKKKDDKGKPLFSQIQHQQYIKIYETGTKQAIQELSELKDILDNHILEKPSKPLNYLILESSNPIPIVVSSITYPIYNFKGKKIQNLLDIVTVPEQLIFNAFNSNGKGFVLFSWLNGSKIIDRFVDSLMTFGEHEIFSSLVYFFFSSAENSFISPNWWESLSINQKNKIQDLIMTEVSTSNSASNNTLIVDIRFEGWNVEKIHKV